MKSKIERLGKVSITVEKDYWNINKTYNRLTIVERQGTHTAYLSRKIVPIGIDITDRNYWITISKWSDIPYEIVQEFGDSPEVVISQKVVTLKINELQEFINNINEIIREGGSIDERIATAKSELIDGASEEGDTFKKIEDRLSDVEESVGEGGSVDERIAVERNRAQAAEELLREAYESLSQSQPIPKTAEEWVAMTSFEEGVIYRVAGTTSYTDYMYNGTTPIPMATYNNAIDNTPTANSANLVTSGGVAEELALGAVYDVSAKNPTAGPNNDGKWESLSALLSDANLNTLIPISVRKGGMSVKFVQSSDNKYLQYRLMSDTFNTTVANWQGVDDVPTAGSNNIVKSNGVYEKIQGIESYAIPCIMSPLTTNTSYWVNNGIYQNFTRDQTTDVIYVRKGARISVNFSHSHNMTLRYGLFASMPVNGDTASSYGSSMVSPCIIEVQNDGFLAISHYTNTNIEITSLSRAIDTDDIEDKAVTIDKIEFSIIKNLFDINDAENVLNKYINKNVLIDNNKYNTTGYIKVEPNTTYQCSCDGDAMAGVALARVVCQYRVDKSYISDSDLQPSNDTNRFTTGSETYFVRVSAENKYWQKYQIEKGSESTYWTPHRIVIDPQYIPDEDIKEIANETFKLNFDFGHFEGISTLSQNKTMSLPQSYSRRNVTFSALINGSDSVNLDVLIGLGYGKYRGGWLELTPTKIIVHEYFTSDSVTEYNHGLTLGSDTVVSFDSHDTEAVIKVISDGNIFSQDIIREFYFGGAGFVTNKGADNIDVKFSVMLKDITEKIWIFGDSYLSWNDNARWTNWLLQWGFTSWMSDSLPGGHSDVGYTSFINDNKIGKPVYLLWTNGMNDTADVDVNTPDSTWLNYVNNVISGCEGKGVTPILATIPSVPSKLHDGKNKWIRESGYRYIDFAAAVGATSEGVWKEGMLYSDNVHPTQLGAKALASQVLVDFPEIMLK